MSGHHLAPTADVVICTYTDARWDLLERAVASVQAQSVAPGQILVCVDHNDALLERCLATWGPAAAPSGPPIQVFANRYPGRLGSAPNTAVERVTAEVVAFLDDDAAADPTWLETLLEVYVEEGAVAVGGAPLPDHQVLRPGWFPPSSTGSSAATTPGCPRSGSRCGTSSAPACRCGSMRCGPWGASTPTSTTTWTSRTGSRPPTEHTRSSTSPRPASTTSSTPSG
jgi:glycosyltransferase involved in cell wall biosynthesis